MNKKIRELLKYAESMEGKFDKKYYKRLAEELALRVIWAMKFMAPKGHGQVYHHKTHSMQSWEGWFEEALAIAGVKVGRPAKKPVKKVKKAS